MSLGDPLGEGVGGNVTQSENFAFIVAEGEASSLQKTDCKKFALAIKWNYD